MTTKNLLWAALSGTLADMKQKIQEYDVNELDDRKRTAFLRAAYSGDVGKMELLIRHNSSLASVDDFGRSALHLAAKQNCVGAVLYLLSLDADVEKRDNYGRQAHHLAALKGAMGTLRVLLGDQNFNIQPTMNEVDKMKLLERRNSSLASVDKYGRSALHLAAKQDCVEAVQFLLSLGVDVEKRDDYKRQAHHLAALKGAMGTLRVLLGDPNVNNEPTMNEVGKMELLKRLNSVDEFGRSPLHLAAKDDRVEVVKYLLRLDDDVQRRDGCGRQAHHLAAMQESLGTLVVLLDHPNVDIYAVDDFNSTAFDIADNHEKPKAKMLLMKWADKKAGSLS